jgi:5-methylcytosine-specific restriction endonuclease McrA
VNSLGPPRATRRTDNRDVLTLPVLLLNRHFAPVSVATVRRAVVLLFSDAAHAVDAGETYDFQSWLTQPVRSEDDGLPIVGGEVRVPRVLHLLRYDRAPRVAVRLTRRNLMIRDSFQCQYCGRSPTQRDLNVDHVVPRSRGGLDSWENLVVSCRTCNLRKGRRTPTEAGMALLTVPHRPRWTTATQIRLITREPFAEWHPFLQTG